MTKEILIAIKGVQEGLEEEPVVLTATGSYHLTKAWHYIQYVERLSEEQPVIKSNIKISPQQVILTKSGVHFSQMIFDLNEVTQTSYNTPYGNLILDILTKSIQVEESTEKIEATMEYSLMESGKHLSNNKIYILISAKE